MTARYVVMDEPAPGGLSQYAANPLWPFLALMLGGGWLGWPWFVFNAWATGSSTRKQETLLAVAGLVGSAAIFYGALTGLTAIEEMGHEFNVARARAYLFLGVIAWRLLMGYLIFMRQARTFHLFEYFGGASHKNAWIILMMGFFLRGRVLDLIPGGGSDLTTTLITIALS